MKALKYIVWSVIIFLGVFYVLPVGILQVPYFQEKISKEASDILREKLGTEVQIQRVDFELFNKLILKDLYLQDQSGDTLFQAKRVAVGFDLLPLFKKKLRFSSAQIFSFQVNLSKETKDSPLNLQFVLDAFASKDTIKKATDIDLKIKNLNLRRGVFSYRVKDTGQTPGKFNTEDIRLKDLSAKIHLHDLTTQQLIANISRLSFIEQSGIEIKRLTFDLAINKKEAKIKALELQFPRTTLHLADIRADYSHLKNTDNLINDTRFNLEIKPSDIYLKDISPLVPVLANFKDKITLQGLFSGTLNDLTLSDFYIRDKEHFMIRADAHLVNITSSENIYIDGIIQQSFISAEGIQRMANNFSSQPTHLPDQVVQLGNIRFNGEVSGYLHHLSAFGIFQTDIGSVRTDIQVGKNETRFVKGRITSDGLDLRKLMNNDDYGTAVFHVDVDAIQDKNNQFSGKTNAIIDKIDFKGYTYNNLNLNGEFTQSSFKGSLGIDSPEGKISAEGLFVLKGENSEFNFSAEVNNVLLDKLNLTKKYNDSELSFRLDANFTGNNIDNLLGNILLSDLRFSTEKGGYFLDTLSVESTQSDKEKILRLSSDLAKGEIRGVYSFKSIVPAIKQTLSAYLPSLIGHDPKTITGTENRFAFDFAIQDMQEISYILDLPFTLQSDTRLSGEYNSVFRKFKLEAYAPLFNVKGSTFESVLLLLNNEDGKVQLNVSGTSLQKRNNKLSFSAQVSALNDSVYTVFNWDSNRAKKYKGTLALAALFSKQSGPTPLKTQLNIRPSEMIFNDSIWTLHPASVVLDSGKVFIRGLVADHADQFITIDGIVSKDVDDQLSVNLNKVDLEYIFQSLNIPALTFGGIATGYVHAQDLFKTRQLSTSLDVKNFSFNNTSFGDLTLQGLWDEEKQGILMDGHIFKDDTTQVKIDGIINPVKKELSIVFDAQNANAAFLRKYLDKVVQNLSGKLSGKLRLFGDLNNPTVEGNVFVKEGRFGVGFLNTYYTFTDSVKCLPDEIRIQDVNFYDKNGWPALAKGYVKHKQFSKFQFSASLSYDNFLLFDATKRQNPYFYGTAYGTGSASIRGNESIVNIDVSMANTSNTKIFLNFMEATDITEYNFINFVSKKEDSVSTPESFLSLLSKKPILLKTDTETDIRFNLNMNANPDAEIEMIMDPVSGDKISAKGKGNMQVQYGTKSPLKIFGNYTIEQGEYDFSLQQAIFRHFKIQDGSSVSFRGDPYTAELNIDATYLVTANLGDLDQQLLQQSLRNSVPVNCILLLNGPMDHPSIGFDISLPNSTPELTRQVKSYIRTEEMMNRQMVFLLVLGRFYTPPEFQKSDDTRMNNDFSFLASTLSTQLSNILGTISEKFQLGTRFNQTNRGDETSTEVELLLSSQLLNNRLIINGNFGYMDNPYNSNQSKDKLPLVGDFDVEYKLTKSGDIRLKGYNHYNYRNFNSITPEFTQGVGILFRKDFNTVYDLVGKKKKQVLLPPPTISTDTIQIADTLKTDGFIHFKSTKP